VTAGWRSVFDIFLPQQSFDGYLNSALTFVMVVCLLIVMVASVRRWYAVLVKKTPTPELEVDLA
jgi:hypothetical protein